MGTNRTKKEIREAQKRWKKFLFAYLKDYKLGVTIVIGLIFVIAGVELLPRYIYKLVVDKLTLFGTGGSDQSTVISSVILLLGIVLACFLSRIVFDTARILIVNRIQTKILRDVSIDFVKKILGLSFDFHTQKKTGKISRRFSRGVSAVEQIVDAVVFNLVPNVFRLLIILVIYFIFDWKSSAILLVTIIIFTLVTYQMNKRQETLRKKQNDYDDKASGVAIDDMMNAE